MYDTESIIVHCPREHLPPVGDRVRAEQGPEDKHGVTWVLATADRRLRAIGMIDENHDDVDMTFIVGMVERIDVMHPIPKAFSSRESMERHVAKTGPVFAVWVKLEGPHPYARQVGMVA